MFKIKLYKLICLGLILAACGGTTQTPTSDPQAGATTVPTKSGTIRYAENANASVKDVPLLMALDDLRAQGYTVEMIPLSTSTLVAEAIAQGNADIVSLNTQSMWTSIAKGSAVRTISQRAGSTLVVAAASDVMACGDLNGKAIGVTNTTGINPALLNAYIQQTCPEVEYQPVVIADNAGRVAALISGEVAAVIVQEEEMINIENEAPGKFHILVRLYQEFSKVQTSGFHVRQEWAQQNPELVKDFIKAVLLANRAVIKNPQLVYDEALTRVETDKDSAKLMADLYLNANAWDPNGALTEENIQYTLDFLTGIEAVPAGLKVEDVADLSYLNAVLEEIGRQ